jgi:alkenylglycerophosphocholine hydrolase
MNLQDNAQRESKVLIVTFTLLCLVYFICLVLQLDSWRVLAKALPVICLTIWVGKFANLRYSKLIRAGLAMSVGGDILLELHDIQPLELRFLGGLGCFLIAHICYSLFFALQINSHRKNTQINTKTDSSIDLQDNKSPSKSKYQFSKSFESIYQLYSTTPKAVLIGVISYAGLLIFWLSPLIGKLLLPVMIYIVAISLMLILAWNFYLIFSNRSKPNHGDYRAGRWALFAGLCFVLSDSLLALNLFVLEAGSHIQMFVHYAVMVTYWLAQLGFALMVYTMVGSYAQNQQIQ